MAIAPSTSAIISTRASPKAHRKIGHCSAGKGTGACAASRRTFSNGKVSAIGNSALVVASRFVSLEWRVAASALPEVLSAVAVALHCISLSFLCVAATAISTASTAASAASLAAFSSSPEPFVPPWVCSSLNASLTGAAFLVEDDGDADEVFDDDDDDDNDNVDGDEESVALDLQGACGPKGKGHRGKPAVLRAQATSVHTSCQQATAFASFELASSTFDAASAADDGVELLSALESLRPWGGFRMSAKGYPFTWTSLLILCTVLLVGFVLLLLLLLEPSADSAFALAGPKCT